MHNGPCYFAVQQKTKQPLYQRTITMIGNTSQGRPAPHYGEAGKWLRKQREYWQITQAELAEQIGIRDVSMLAGIEQGEIALPTYLREAIAMVFRVNRADLAAYCDEWYGQLAAKAA
jgi:DNA-binding XRE family transcriptional regulator